MSGELTLDGPGSSPVHGVSWKTSIGTNNMRPDLYQAETKRIATQQGALLRQAKDILAEGRTLTLLEKGGVLHALQVLIENAIGKACLNSANTPCRTSHTHENLPHQGKGT